MKQTANSHMFTAALSHPGQTEKNNEDRFAISAFQLSDQVNTPATFAIVADGVGGHNAGEIAAEIAVNVITDTIANSDGQSPLIILQNAIIQASNEIYNQSLTDPAQAGMGSTCVCAWIIGQKLYIANVGDSRLYLIRDNQIYQLTKDHSWIQEAIDHGVVNISQAKNHPRSHIINRYLGSKVQVVPDFHIYNHPTTHTEQTPEDRGILLQPKDTILLCSDGLTDVVEDDEILTLVTQNEGTKAIQELISLANQRGGPDNITVALLEIPSKGISRKKLRFPKFNRRILLGSSCLISLLILVLLIILSFGLIWYKGNIHQPTTTPAPAILSTHPLEAEQSSNPNTSSPQETGFISPTDSLQEFPLSATYTPWPTSTQPAPTGKDDTP